MKISSLGFVILSLLICTNFHSASSYSCYNDTESLNEAIFISGESQKTYHICAGTKIKTGNFDNNQDKYVNGSHPIIMAYSGIKVLCGAHGNVEDNCVFSNGETGVEIIHPGYYKPPVDSVIMLNNLYIEGFTFSELTNVPIYSYYAALGGVDITMKNCKFLVSFCNDVIMYWQQFHQHGFFSDLNVCNRYILMTVHQEQQSNINYCDPNTRG